MKREKKVHILEHILTQTVDEESILLDTQRELYFGLDAIGCVMWEQLERDPSVEALKEYMLAHYDVSQKELEDDLVHFLNHLVENKLIRLERYDRFNTLFTKRGYCIARSLYGEVGCVCCFVT